MRFTAAPGIRLVDFEAAMLETRTRIPFRYGIACLTAAPSLLVRVTIEAPNGERATGLAGDGLPPLWFDKDPSKDFRANVEDQLSAVREARRAWFDVGREPRPLAAIWTDALPAVVEACSRERINALTASFGSSLIERAALDALCRLHRMSLFEALAHDLTGLHTAPLLPPRPATHIGCRHTVGLGDPITVAEIPAEERLDDGLPQSLDECIAAYGLRYFKVKVRGDHDADLDRLTRIAELLDDCHPGECHPGEFVISLDGNEQYRDPTHLAELLRALEKTPDGKAFVDAIEFIEQPLHRDVALSPDAEPGIRELSRIRPVVIDESDDSLDSFARAIELGYTGTSHKNCKGVLKSLANRSRTIAANVANGGVTPYFQTAEDLANLPVIPLLQDLAVVVALGIRHVERNGHHYFRGLDHLPRSEAESALEQHGDLFERRRDGGGESVFLRIEGGEISTASLARCVGLGYDADIAFDARTPLEEWSFSS